MSPESLDQLGAEMEYRRASFSSGVLDFSNGDTQNDLIMSTVSEEELHIAFGIARIMDLYYDLPKESVARFGGRVQLLGNPKKSGMIEHKVAFTFGMGAEVDKIEDTYTVNVKAKSQDFSVIHGFRFSPSFMMYEGISLTNYSFEGTIEDPVGLSSDHFLYEAENTLGAHIGVIWGPSYANLKAEFAAQQIAWTDTDEKRFYAISFSFNTGW